MSVQVLVLVQVEVLVQALEQLVVVVVVSVQVLVRVGRRMILQVSVSVVVMREVVRFFLRWRVVQVLVRFLRVVQVVVRLRRWRLWWPCSEKPCTAPWGPSSTRVSLASSALTSWRMRRLLSPFTLTVPPSCSLRWGSVSGSDPTSVYEPAVEELT